MANEGVSGFYLPSEKVNRAGELAAKARGIVACIGMAGPREDEMPQHSISNACWAVQDLLEELQEIAETRRDAQSEVQQ